MNKKRRSLICALGSGVIAIPLSALTGSSPALAADMPKLNPDDANAKALEYSHESSDAAKLCSGCQLFTDASAEWGPCVIFPGHLVSAQGWCKSWFARA